MLNCELIVCLSWIVYWQCMHSCCSWINYDTVLNLNLLCRWCNAPKKKSRECLWVVECWNSIQEPKGTLRNFFFVHCTIDKEDLDLAWCHNGIQEQHECIHCPYTIHDSIHCQYTIQDKQRKNSRFNIAIKI